MSKVMQWIHDAFDALFQADQEPQPKTVTLKIEAPGAYSEEQVLAIIKSINQIAGDR